MNRERAVREKRALKAEKKAEKAAAKLMAANGEMPVADDEGVEAAEAAEAAESDEADEQTDT